MISTIVLNDKCDWLCKNQPCEHIKIDQIFQVSVCLTYALYSYTNKIKILLLLQNLMENHLRFKT